MSKDEVIEVRCPECGAILRVPLAEAERTMRGTCPKGHDVPLVKALNGA